MHSYSKPIQPHVYEAMLIVMSGARIFEKDGIKAKVFPIGRNKYTDSMRVNFNFRLTGRAQIKDLVLGLIPFFLSGEVIVVSTLSCQIQAD